MVQNVAKVDRAAGAFVLRRRRMQLIRAAAPMVANRCHRGSPIPTVNSIATPDPELAIFQEPAMYNALNTYAITAPRERATAFALAAFVTLTVLASLGDVADQQYDSALLAQATVPAVMAAAQPTEAHA
jgi:hypothetical protein